MDIPQLPTDNLYKFLALAGVLVSIVGFLAPEVAEFELAQREIELERSREVLVSTGKRLIEKIKDKKSTQNERNKQIVVLNEGKQKFGCVAPNGLDLCKQEITAREEFDEDNKAIDDGFDQLVKWKAETAQADSAERILKYLREKNTRFRTISEFAMWGGLILAFVGFTFWYWLVQRFQDGELRRKATIPTATIEESKE